MIADIRTILGKELKEILNARGKKRSGLFSVLIFAGIFGIYMPLTSGTDWVDTPISLFYWLWFPFLMVSSTIADAIAGERERHTLETLLASRLSDMAILLGKVAAALTYGWGMSMVIMLISLVTLNIAFGIPDGTFYSYQPMLMVVVVVFSFLVALLSAGIGIIVSLRAETVKQAQQVVSMGFTMLFFVFLLAIKFLPQALSNLIEGWIEAANWNMLAISAFLVLAIVDVVLLLIAKARFQRAKLILD